MGYLLICLVWAACAVSSAQELKKEPPILQPGISQSAVAETSTCSEQPQVIRVPSSLAIKARVKARLLNLLRTSLFDDAKGVVNVVQEKEIRKLANELRKEDPQPY
jgi:hypothetical protein